MSLIKNIAEAPVGNIGLPVSKEFEHIFNLAISGIKNFEEGLKPHERLDPISPKFEKALKQVLIAYIKELEKEGAILDKDLMNYVNANIPKRRKTKKEKEIEALDEKVQKALKQNDALREKIKNTTDEKKKEELIDKGQKKAKAIEEMREKQAQLTGQTQPLIPA